MKAIARRIAAARLDMPRSVPPAASGGQAP